MNRLLEKLRQTLGLGLPAIDKSLYVTLRVGMCEEWHTDEPTSF